VNTMGCADMGVTHHLAGAGFLVSVDHSGPSDTAGTNAAL
jgi:hypothetical protein